MAIQQIRLDPFDTQSVALPSIPLSPGTHTFQIQTRANYILSSLFLVSVSGSVEVNWYQTTTGALGVERQPLATHGVIPSGDPAIGTTGTISVTSIHNKPVVEIIVSGGPCEIGLYITGLPGVGSKIDRALIENGDDASSGLHYGLITAGLDYVANQFRYIAIDPSGAVLTSSAAQDAGVVLSGEDTFTSYLEVKTLLTASAPSGTRYRILGTVTRATGDSLVEVLDGAAVVAFAETTFENRSPQAHAGITIPVTSSVTVRATNKSVFPGVNTVSVILYLKAEIVS